MIFNILALLAGDICVQLLSNLLSLKLCLMILMLSIVLVLSIYKLRRLSMLVAFFCFGFFYTTWCAQSILAWTLPHELEGRALTATGVVSSLVNKDSNGLHFNLKLKTLSEDVSIAKYKPNVKINWRDGSIKIKPGDELQLSVRLKRIHSTQNPGGFDAEKWALQEHLRAMGQVLPHSNNNVIAHHYFQYMFTQVRQNIRDRITQTLPRSTMLPWITALTIGDRSDVNQDEWEVLRKTGTNHLMAIAGLHIGMVAAMAAWLAALLWRFVPALILRYPRIHFENVVLLIATFLYAGLAGFSLPSQRACVMIVVLSLATLSRRKLNAWLIWASALAGVILIDPLAVLSDSFWLSFCTIALVIYGMRGRLNVNTYWWKWGRIQWVIGFGLIPLSLFLFQECSVISFIANCVTIPWLACVVLPLCLLSALLLYLCPPLAYLSLLFTDAALKILWTMLSWFASLPFAAFHYTIPTIELMLAAVLGILLLLLPSGFYFRWLGLLCFIPIIFYEPPVPNSGSVWLTVLDVGQGLSAVITTNSHVLLYDAGPRLSASADAGERIIAPYLYSRMITTLDAMVISHGDNDHIGGAPAIMKAFNVKQIYTSVTEKLPSPVATFCEAGKSWQWDGVMFTFLYPTRADIGLVNDSSCVLKITAGSQSILLPGDIEKRAERQLLAKQYNQLASTVIIAPHHGSKTSGMLEFINAVNPRYVIYAAGYRNRYHLPNEGVVASYAERGVIAFNTINDGAITMRLDRGKPYIEVEQYRAIQHKYWFDL